MRGDEGAFDALIERQGDHLHSVARRILRDPYLAEDATQRASLHVAISAHPQGPGPVRGLALIGCAE